MSQTWKGMQLGLEVYIREVECSKWGDVRSASKTDEFYGMFTEPRESTMYDSLPEKKSIISIEID